MAAALEGAGGVGALAVLAHSRAGTLVHIWTWRHTHINNIRPERITLVFIQTAR